MSRQSKPLSELLLTICPFFTIFPALLLVLGGRATLAKFLGDSEELTVMLTGCRNWCLLMFGAAAAGILLTLAVTILAGKVLKKRRASGVWKDLVKMALIPLAVEIGLCGLMLRNEVLPAFQDIQADLRQIREETAEAQVVYFQPGSYSTHLPVPYTSGQPEPVDCFQVMEEKTGEVYTVYLPKTLGFTPEGTYHMSRSASWNEENIPRYEIICTDHLHLVLSVQSVDAAG